jgi:hypothetical protein
MTAPEIHVNGEPATRLQAARALAEVDSGKHVTFGPPGGVTVYGRQSSRGGTKSASVGCASFRGGAAEIQQQVEKLAIARELIELAEMIAAERAHGGDGE